MTGKHNYAGDKILKLKHNRDNCQGNQSEKTGRKRAISHEKCRPDSSFYNLPDLVPLKLAAKVLNVSVKTLYDWKYRGKVRQTRIPPNLFTRICGQLYLRKDTLILWVLDRNSS